MIGCDSALTEGMAARKHTASQIYELYVELEYVEPPIWRRLLVPATITLPKLHDLLQLAMARSVDVDISRSPPQAGFST